ncbi:protein spdB [Kitasatospora acidiphila]|uniref:protein spdB n=1 Tax=Kitasatospora acidiphila TaxID=2567942 RepID=UPI003C76ACF1
MSVRQIQRRARLAAPALVTTLVSAVLTVAVIVLWLGSVMPVPLAAVIGAGFDAAWLAALAYERRLAGQGDHDRRVAALGWLFGVLATGVLVAHALTTAAPAAWLAVSWLPLAAKSMWWLHGLWEATAISPRAQAQISRVLQESRDDTALSRAALLARTQAERVRMESLTRAGTTIARVQARSAGTLAGAWADLDEVGQDEEQVRALERVAAPAAALDWSLPAWTPISALRPEAAALSAGDGAEVRPETDGDEVSPWVKLTARLRSEGVGEESRVPEQAPARLSVAAAVRHLVAEGETDPKAVMARVPELTGSQARPETIRRELRAARAAQQQTAPAAVRFGFQTEA